MKSGNGGQFELSDFDHGKFMRSHSSLPLGGLEIVCGILFPPEVAKLASINFVKDVCTGVLVSCWKTSMHWMLSSLPVVIFSLIFKSGKTMYC